VDECKPLPGGSVVVEWGLWTVHQGRQVVSLLPPAARSGPVAGAYTRSHFCLT